MSNEYEFHMLSYPLEANRATDEFIENPGAYNFILSELEKKGLLEKLHPIVCFTTMLNLARHSAPDLFTEFKRRYPEVFNEYYERRDIKMIEKEMYRSLTRDFFIKELEAKGVDCAGLSLEEVLALAEKNNIAGADCINPKLLETSNEEDEKHVDLQPEEVFKETPEEVSEPKKEDFMEEYAKEMDDEISKGREEIETSKAYLENLLKSNGIDTKDLSYTYMLDLAAKLQKDLEPKEEETKVFEETSEEKHIWDDSEISKDYKEDPSEPTTTTVQSVLKEVGDAIMSKKHECTCEECDCDKPQEEHLTRRGKILKGFLVKELSAIDAINKDWLKSAYYSDIINAANAFPHIMKKWETSPEFEEYKLATEDAINNVINFVSDRKDNMIDDTVETKVNEALYHNTIPGTVAEFKMRDLNKSLSSSKLQEENHTPSAMVVNRSFMQGFLYSKTDIGILRLNNMSNEELFEECKKFVGFKSSLDKFNFIVDLVECECEFGCEELPKSDTVNKSIKDYSTKELTDELFTRGGIESYWLGPNSTYTLDIAKPEDSVHTNMYYNGSGPLWIIFNYD